MQMQQIVMYKDGFNVDAHSSRAMHHVITSHNIANVSIAITIQLSFWQFDKDGGPRCLASAKTGCASMAGESHTRSEVVTACQCSRQFRMG
jgi:hypothetical protein